MFISNKKFIKLIFNCNILNEVIEIYINKEYISNFQVETLGQHIFEYKNYDKKLLELEVTFKINKYIKTVRELNYNTLEITFE
jgi:hypothetical protein